MAKPFCVTLLPRPQRTAMTDLVNAPQSAEVRHCENLMVISEFAIIVVLVGWALLSRLPFFFSSQMDWDESTFILMGQGILYSALPYDKLWDFKAPLAF